MEDTFLFFFSFLNFCGFLDFFPKMHFSLMLEEKKKYVAKKKF